MLRADCSAVIANTRLGPRSSVFPEPGAQIKSPNHYCDGTETSEGRPTGLPASREKLAILAILDSRIASMVHAKRRVHKLHGAPKMILIISYQVIT